MICDCGNDGWGVVEEYADTVAHMVEVENQLRVELKVLREKLARIERLEGDGVRVPE